MGKCILAGHVEGIKIATGSYAGTGTSGSANPNSLIFPFEPKLIFIAGTNGDSTTVPPDSLTAVFVNPLNKYTVNYNGSSSPGRITQWGTTVKWYAAGGAGPQYNAANIQYYYVAIG